MIDLEYFKAFVDRQRTTMRQAMYSACDYEIALPMSTHTQLPSNYHKFRVSGANKVLARLCRIEPWT